MYDRVVHMHESCEYDIVRTGETFKTARVLKVSYKRVNENKYARLKPEDQWSCRRSPSWPSKAHNLDNIW